MCDHNHLCCIIPSFMLENILQHPHASENSKACARRSLGHNRHFHGARIAALGHHEESHGGGGGGAAGGPPRQGFVPPQVHQHIMNDPNASEEQRQRAESTLNTSANFRAARAGEEAPTAAAAKAKHVNRTIYDCKKTNNLPGTQVRKEGGTGALDSEENNVWVSFGNTFNFYSTFLQRNSIDNKGLGLVGSVHYDDEEPPPGYDNAFWDGQQMVFGDGDAEIFQDFTAAPDVIGHELTHGVTQYTANLPYHQQSGALNESMSDCFGIMIKQWNGGQNSVKATDADWLIGEGIFYPSTGIKALRSMKAPGTAYKNSVIGTDNQPDNMANYQNLPDTDQGDYGGVHTNSGIPNKAFYLVCTGLEGYSWEIAGHIWYDTLLDSELKTFAAQKTNYSKVFSKFADLTIKHAKDSKYKKQGKDIPAIVKKAWDTVGVKYTAT